MNDAALRYSPEMALAFQPTLTLRPATKKSCAVLDLRADQKPIQTVAMTVAALKARIQGSMCINHGVPRRGEGCEGLRRQKFILASPPSLLRGTKLVFLLGRSRH